MITAKRVDIAETKAAFAQVRAAAGGVEEPVALGNVRNAVIQFTQISDYTTFLVEYAFLDGNIIVHFFPPIEAYVGVGDGRRVVEEFSLYWQRRFPLVLSPVAEDYFKATLPVISAKYTPELQSWYFKAGGFANRLDPDSFILGFFARLDEALDRAAAGAAPVL